ncbi:LacI family transcriptional regulator [Hoeflea marina]|uniref:LacI family transcriptional regulator n=1 Tax=Hoeflea marina TaxID=274592 RepID=A0A317PMD9_9HYPH|nr:LacI family DNA-binding transcriptional regulator [Hoeflea marina]PWW01926.1 LacI family transcriptional regulator [Hoeflea marina]
MSEMDVNDKGRRSASSADVAALAGVSRATVSRCFTDGTSVKGDTRQRVLAAARTLGYEPNLLARMLNKQESNIVAVLTSDFANPFQPALMEALTSGMRAEQLTPLLLKGTSPMESADELIQLALSYRVAAIVVTVLNASQRMIERCFEAHVPLIFLNRVAEDTPATSVCLNSRSGARRVAEIFVESGTTRIGMISGNTGSWTNSMRRGGFRERLDELGHDLLGHIQGDFSYQSGHKAALQLMADFPRLDAIYACNDAMAFGAMDAIRFVRGARVPDDISVVGFDDVPVAAWGAYRLTTIHQPVAQMVEQTIQILKRPDRGLGLSEQVFLYDGHLVQRDTTRPVTLREGESDETTDPAKTDAR